MFKLHQATTSSFFVILMSLFILTAPAFAVHPDGKSEIENLKKRIEVLEAQKASPATKTQEEDADFGRISKFVTLHGLIEAEAYYVKADGEDQESDLSLTTVELSIESTLNEHVGGHLTLLYEEEAGAENDIDVDEAVISLNSLGDWSGAVPSLHIGRMYLPFGMFNSYMISNPLTLELGEAQDTASLFALEGENWVFKTAIFEGDTNADEENRIDSWISSIEVAAFEGLSFGASYISDLAESDIVLVQDTALYSSSVAGASTFLSAHLGQFGFEAEYLAALENFDTPLVAVGEDLTGQRPEAWNLELSWMPTEQIQVACRYEQAKDFQDDVRRYGTTASYGLYEHVVVALEYLHADADVPEDDKVNTVTAQLDLEF